MQQLPHAGADRRESRGIENRCLPCPQTIFTSNVAMDMLKLNDRIVDRIYRRSLKLPLPEKAVRSMQADAENMKFMQEILKNAP